MIEKNDINSVLEEEKTKECSKISIKVMLGNLLISCVYLFTGIYGHSVAALSEGVDSLTDAGGSLLLLLGFKISARKPDSLHPNGHKRMEYIIGLLISEIILAAAFSLGRQAINCFMNPTVSTISFALLIASIIGAIGKLLIANYLKLKNAKYRSPSLKVYYKNTLADLKGICFVAVTAIVQHFTTFPVDAMAGIVLAVMIGWDGLKSFFENVSLILGEEKDMKQENHSYAN